jgi:hypothetical protein
MSGQKAQQDSIRSQLERDARQLGGLPPQELQELADLAAAIAALPDEAPSEAELERGRGRLLAALQGQPASRWSYGLPLLKAAAVLVMAVVLGLLALGGAFAAGARLPQPVAVGPLSPLSSERPQTPRDNHGRNVAEVARSGSGPGHGQEVRQAALDNPGLSGPGHPDQASSGGDNSGPGSASSQDNIRLVGTVQQQAQGRLVVNGITVLLTVATEVEGQVGPGAIVKVEGTLQGDGTIVAREIEVRVQPGPPATPPAAPAAVEIELRGTVQALLSGGFVVAGRTVRITGGTEVEGQVTVGATVKVEGTVQGDGSVLARQVEVEQPGGPSTAGPSHPPQVPDHGGRGRGPGGD